MSSQLFTAFFTDSGLPVLGLTPTITIWKLSDNSIVINADSTTETGGGFYEYLFTSMVDFESYSIRWDGGVTLSDSDRYLSMSVEATVKQDAGKIC